MLIGEEWCDLPNVKMLYITINNILVDLSYDVGTLKSIHRINFRWSVVLTGKENHQWREHRVSEEEPFPFSIDLRHLLGSRKIPLGKGEKKTAHFIDGYDGQIPLWNEIGFEEQVDS